MDTSLERYRAYLALLARWQVTTHLRGKIDLSGVVQQTLLEAYQALERLRDRPPEVQAAWLRQALANNLRDEVRRLTTAAERLVSVCSLSTNRLTSPIASLSILAVSSTR